MKEPWFMNEDTRRAAAYIICRLATSKPSLYIYDFTAEKHFNFKGTISEAEVVVYDEGRKCHVQGKVVDGKYQMFDHGTDQHFLMEKESETLYKGYDLGTEKHFAANVEGEGVSIYDYEFEKYFQYSIQQT